MEHVNIKLNNPAEFDQAVHGGLPEGGDITLITKDRATEGGAAAVVLAWTVQLPGGGVALAQAVTTVKCLKMALAALQGRYDDDGRLRPHLAN